MSSIHCLQVDLGVPVGVINDNMVGWHQVDAKTTSSNRDEEDLFAGTGAHELIDLFFSLIEVGGSIKPTETSAFILKIVLNNIQSFNEAREKEYLLTLGDNLVDDSVDKDKLSRSFHDMRAELGGTWWFLFWE